jgi:hypothetical protein
LCQKWGQVHALMESLVTVLLKHKLSGFASVVPIDIYKDVFPGCGEYDAYYLSVKHAIVALANVGNAERSRYGFGGLKCWFEDSDSTARRTREIHRQLRAVPSWPCASCLEEVPLFESKRLIPLQAADLVAREAFKHFDNLGTRPIRIPVKRMEYYLNFSRWNRAGLEYVRDNGGPDNLETLTGWIANRPKAPNLEIFCGATSAMGQEPWWKEVVF